MLSAFVICIFGIYFIVIQLCSCNKENSIKNANALTSFRKQVEETAIEKSQISKPSDATDNLVSFFVNNINELFGETSEKNEFLESTTSNEETTIIASRKTIAVNSLNIEDKSIEFIDKKDLSFDPESNKNKVSYDEAIHEKIPDRNMSVYAKTTITEFKSTTYSKITTEIFEDLKEKLFNTSKELLILKKAEKEESENKELESIDPLILKQSFSEKEQRSTRRSCIFCNNVALIDCYDPQNKLISSHICEREEDLCYSQHTPFGIVDRGCFNVNHNESTYVCSCNLCNYIPITEMPYLFSTKRDWIENVIELSRTKQFRRTILKDISCLRCEVNISSSIGNKIDNANCLQGKVGKLPNEECLENQICGVKAVRSDGYIWRGCVNKPLFNYWWTFCDSDLCNYDSLVSIYDEL